MPVDNPFVGAVDTLPEIWASGLRNPYRFGFDRLNGDLWIGDVGQEMHEEVDRIAAGDNSGPNFGWHCYEGNSVYDTTGCLPPSNYVFPITVHDHPVNGGNFCAVIGGRVYRGAAFPHLYGAYIYGDVCNGELWTLLPDGLGGWVDRRALQGTLNGLTCIGDGVDGELYATDLGLGELFKIIDHCPMDPPVIIASGDTLISTAAIAYQWYLDEDTVPGAHDQAYVPFQNGIYSVAATFANGCVLRSDTIHFAMEGIPGRALPTITAAPLPAGDHWYLDRGATANTDWSGTVFDAQGRTVTFNQWPAGSTRLLVPVRDLATGLYTIVLRDAVGGPVVRIRAAVAH